MNEIYITNGNFCQQKNMGHVKKFHFQNSSHQSVIIWGGGGGPATIWRPLKLTTMVVFRDNFAHMVVNGRFLFKFQSAVPVNEIY